MFESQYTMSFAALLGTLGIWLMLPRGTARGRGVGTLLASIAMGLGVSQTPGLGDWLSNGLFLILAAVTIVSAAAAVTCRNPVYCAIWFGLSLLGTAGLMLMIGAQFLAVATVVVYAGAILVTFLFVLMLAQPEGKAAYDRVSWEALLSASTGILIVGVLSIAIGAVCSTAEPPGHMTAPATDRAMAAGILAPEHVARLGSELFSRYLLAVEIAGTLLLTALVGAAVMIARQRTD